MMKVRVDPDKCIGAGHCVRAAAEVFDQREEDGIVVLLRDEPAPAEQAAVREAAGVCPTSAWRSSRSSASGCSTSP